MKARKFLLGVVLVAGLTACGGEPESAPEPTATVTVTATPTQTATPTPTPTPSPTTQPKSGVTVIYKCEGERYESIEDAWVGQHASCIDTSAHGAPNQRERAAVRLAYGKKRAAVRDVAILYGICGENNPDWPILFPGDTYSSEWARELRGAVLLCPNHPNFDQVGPALAATDKAVARSKNQMTDGTYVVGKDVNPGTWVASSPTGTCYWERTDGDGNIIDNNFSSGARVQFRIRSSDYSVSVEGCGDWKRAS